MLPVCVFVKKIIGKDEEIRLCQQQIHHLQMQHQQCQRIIKELNMDTQSLFTDFERAKMQINQLKNENQQLKFEIDNQQMQSLQHLRNNFQNNINTQLNTNNPSSFTHLTHSPKLNSFNDNNTYTKHQFPTFQTNYNQNNQTQNNNKPLYVHTSNHPFNETEKKSVQNLASVNSQNQVKNSFYNFVK